MANPGETLEVLCQSNIEFKLRQHLCVQTDAIPGRAMQDTGGTCHANSLSVRGEEPQLGCGRERGAGGDRWRERSGIQHVGPGGPAKSPGRWEGPSSWRRQKAGPGAVMWLTLHM